MGTVRVVVENGKYFIGTPVKYFGRHNLIVFGSRFYTADGLNLDFFRGRFDGVEVIIVRGHAIVCEGDKCTIGKWAVFDRGYLDDVVELLRRAEKIRENHNDYFDDWWMTLWVDGSVLQLRANGGVELEDFSGAAVKLEDFLERGVMVFHAARVGDVSGYRALSAEELENKYFYIRYTSRSTFVGYRDGVSRYLVEFDGHVPPSYVERKMPKVLFDVPREVAQTPRVENFHEVEGDIDALPANGREYRVNGRPAVYWNPEDWAIENGGVLYRRGGKDFWAVRGFGNTAVVIRNPTREDVGRLRAMDAPEVPEVPAREVVYDYRSGTVHYTGVDCGDFVCNFRYWGGRFMISGIPLLDGLYDVVAGDWREFFKDDPREINGQMRPLGIWVDRSRVKYVGDGFLVTR